MNDDVVLVELTNSARTALVLPRLIVDAGPRRWRSFSSFSPRGSPTGGRGRRTGEPWGSSWRGARRGAWGSRRSRRCTWRPTSGPTPGRRPRATHEEILADYAYLESDDKAQGSRRPKSFTLTTRRHPHRSLPRSAAASVSSVSISSLSAGSSRIRAASPSGICSTDSSLRSIARLRTPVCSIVRLALLSWRLTLIQDAAEFVELSPHGSKNAPHLRGALLDGQGLEAHAQAGEDRG